MEGLDDYWSKTIYLRRLFHLVLLFILRWSYCHMEGLDEQSSSLAPLPVADLLTHCDQILALRRYVLCTMHFGTMHTLHLLCNVRICCELCTLHCALQQYAHIAYVGQLTHKLCTMHWALHYAHTASGVQGTHVLCIGHYALCTPALCTHCILCMVRTCIVLSAEVLS